jgi:outer membrane biosynthesis protein TonB/pSer/pThr/pTyr-binding forkhead associated (FHA) protein
MGTPDIFLEHKKGGRVQKYLRVDGSREMFVIGSSREADLRLKGDGVSGCHAVLRFRSPHWYVCDVSGTESVLVNDTLVREAQIDQSARIEIAGHRIQLFTKERNTDNFKPAQSEETLEQSKFGALSLHQVVIRVKGRVVETKLLKAGEAFVMNDGETERQLPAPTTGAWVYNEFGIRTVQQRLVGAQEIALADKLQMDRDLKRSVILALIFFVGVISAIGFLNPGKTTETTLDLKSANMIFDAKTIKKKRTESEKIVKVARARAGGTSENAAQPSQAKTSVPEESQAPQDNNKPSAALTSLRKSGLGSLIGKIAKRANKQNEMVAAVGIVPDIEGAGRALFSTGTTVNGGGGSASKPGPSFRLGGIATKGKAGGAGDFKNGTALSGGSVGAGSVMALSDDEETSIEGGLDKDAIAEVIKRNIGQIRYCYERQLSSNPDLYGKVLVKFTIGADGDVAEPRVDGTTLKSAMVEGCILRRLAGWKFPLPKGGTQVRVSYPFLFKALE